MGPNWDAHVGSAWVLTGSYVGPMWVKGGQPIWDLGGHPIWEPVGNVRGIHLVPMWAAHVGCKWVLTGR